MTQSFVRLAILHEGERCARRCRFITFGLGGDGYCGLYSPRKPLADVTAPKRHPGCIAATTEQALDDAVLGAAEKWVGDFRAFGIGDPGYQRAEALENAVVARRSATREGGT